MEEISGFNMEELINVTQLKEGDKVLEPKVEQLLDKLRRLQRGKSILEEEIVNLKPVGVKLQEELEALQTKIYELEGIHKEKQELVRKLQFQLEESEQESDRLLKLNKVSKELLEQHRWEIQEVKLKHRKLRMRFENHLQQLIEQHKQLHSVFSTERLPRELESAEKTKSQLLAAEQLKLAQVHKLDKELQEAKTQHQLKEEAAQSRE